MWWPLIFNKFKHEEYIEKRTFRIGQASSQFGNKRGISERVYRYIKARIFYKLAFSLKLKVYETGDMNHKFCVTNMGARANNFLIIFPSLWD